MDGFITLDRNIIGWRWFKNANVFRVFVYLLLKANYKPCDFENITVKRGQVVTSYPKISEALGITEAKIRTAINNLKTTGEITVKSTSKFSVVTIINYDLYQRVDRQNNSQITVKQQSNNSQITAIEQYKQINKETIKKNTPPTPSKVEENFEKFWNAYPRKLNKAQAQKAWAKLKPDEALMSVMFGALEQQKRSAQWLRDNGQYIPYPATWLNNRRWEDVYEQRGDFNGNDGNKELSADTEPSKYAIEF